MKLEETLPEILVRQVRMLRPDMPAPCYEYRFVAAMYESKNGNTKGFRKICKLKGIKDWRFDIAWPDLKLAVEVEGGGFIEGRHVRGVGFKNDLRKYAHAAYYGWLVYRCDREMIDKSKEEFMAAIHIDSILGRKMYGNFA